MIPWWFMPNALVTGNTYVFKLSEQVTMPQNRILEVIDDVGLPEGVRHQSLKKELKGAPIFMEFGSHWPQSYFYLYFSLQSC